MLYVDEISKYYAKFEIHIINWINFNVKWKLLFE